jgi:hypothetical protein
LFSFSSPNYLGRTLQTKRQPNGERFKKHAAVITHAMFTAAIVDCQPTRRQHQKQPTPSSSECSDVPELPKFPRPTPENSLTLKEEDFVVLKLISQAKKSRNAVYYVGHVLRKIGSQWEIECLRRHRLHLNKFIYPTVPDVSIYDSSDVIRILQTPKIVHMVYHFADDLSSYGSLLR